MGLKSIIQNNKAVIKFLSLFFGSYIVLTLFYQAYLKYGPSEHYFPDFVTHQVAEQSYSVTKLLGFNTFITKDPNTASMLIGVQNNYVVRVIEGCNSISVIILFLSFIIAFWNGVKYTLIYIFFGSLIIYVFNILRIALLSLALHFYPEYNDILHDILFPLVIYGVVFLLWLFWIKYYKKTSRK
jgi:exosortase family protein XrtF